MPRTPSRPASSEPAARARTSASARPAQAASTRPSATRPTSARPAAARISAQPRFGNQGQEIQKFGTLRLLPIALASEARAESCQALNQVLADSMILYSLYKKHHWLVAGPTFYQLHLLFDKHAGEQLELIDLLAERVQSLGGIALGDPRHVAEITRIARPPDGAEEVSAMISRLLDAHEIVIEGIRDAIKKTEANEDYGSNDLLMGDVLRTNELQVWFIAEHLVDVPLVEP